MNESPIPPPEGEKCPHCGQIVSSTATTCPYCGTRLREAGGLSVWRVLGALALVCVALICGAAGGCAILIGAFSTAEGGRTDMWSVYLIAAGCFVVLGACIWGVIKLVKKR